MAAGTDFGPLLTIGAFPPTSFGGRPTVAPGVARVSAQPRPLPAPKVSGNGSFRFPRLGGIGLFQPSLIQLNLRPSNFALQAEREVPAVIALRGTNVNVTV